MNAGELEVLLGNAVRDFQQPHTLRASENVESAGARQRAAMRDNLDQLRRFVSPRQFHASCVKHARSLVLSRHHRAALHTFLAAFWDSQDGALASSVSGVDAANASPSHSETPEDLGHRTSAATLTAVCRFWALLEGDPHLEAPQTAARCVGELRRVTEAVQAAFPHDELLYHHIFNATVLMYECASMLLHKRHHSQAAVFLAWCARCCDSVIKLRTVRYLQWRIRIYTTLCLCYEAAGEATGAHTLAQQLVAQVEDLNELHMLDVVPPSAEDTAELQRCLRESKLLALRFAWVADATEPREEAIGGGGGGGGTGKERGGAKAKGGASGGTRDMAGDTGAPLASATPTTAQELLDRVRMVCQGLSPAQGLSEAVNTLLSIAADRTVRVLPLPGAPRSARAALAALATEALVAALGPSVDAFARQRGLASTGEGAAAAIPSESEATVPSSRPAAPGGRTAAASPKGAAKGKQPVPQQPNGAQQNEANSASPIPLNEVVDPHVMALVVRALLASRCSSNTVERFAEVQRIWLRELAEESGDEYLGLLRDELGLATTFAPLAADECENPRTTAEAAANALDYALRMTRLTESRADIVEDAALLLLAVWERQPHAAEVPGAGHVLAVATRALVAVRHDDALMVGHTALAAIRALASADHEALGVAVPVAAMLAQRQQRFVVNHDCSGRSTDPIAEQLVDAGAATAAGGIWLRTLRDIRTRLHQLLCRLRLRVAVAGRCAGLKHDHDVEVSLLRERERMSHILGRLSLKEQRAVAAIESAPIPEPVSVAEMESKLLAWCGADPLRTAIAHIEIARRHLPSAAVSPTNAAARRRHLDAALASLEEAHQAQKLLDDRLRSSAQNSLDEVVTLDGLSLYFVWAELAAFCADARAFDTIGPAQTRLFDRFVDCGEPAATWNRNMCAWDALRTAAVERSSPLQLEALAAAFHSIAAAYASAVEHVAAEEYEDDTERGPDPRRCRLREVQVSRMRAANALLHALELAVCASSDGLIVRLSHALLNAMLPMLAPRHRSIMLVRPITALLHAFSVIEPRRWSDGALQLLAARTLQAGFETALGLPEAPQRALTTTLLGSFVAVWREVLSRPNPRQEAHMKDAMKDVRFVGAVLSTVAATSKKEGDAAVPAAGAGGPGKGGKGVSKAAQGGGKAAATAPGSPNPDGSGEPWAVVGATPFARSALFLTDRMPIEFLDLLDFICFNVPTGASTLESANNSDGRSQIFPSMLLAVTAALHQQPQAPQGAIARLNEGRADPSYPLLCAHVARELMQRRHNDLALGLCRDALGEVGQRRRVLRALEADALTALRAHSRAASGAAPTSTVAASWTLQQQKAVATLTHRVGEWRRRVAFRKLRSLHLQHDVPAQAMLQLLLGSLLRIGLAREEGSASETAAAAASMAAAPPGSDPSSKLTAAAGSRSKAGSKSKGGAGETAAKAAPEAARPQTPREADDPLLGRKADAIRSVVRSVVLFARVLMPRHAYAAMQHVVNITRAIVADVPPRVMQDLSAALAAADAAASPRSSASLAATASTAAVGMSTTPLSIGAGGAAVNPTKQRQIDGLARIDGELRVLAATIAQVVRAISDGTCSPALERETLQPTGVKCGHDCDAPTRLLRRTTSLHLWLSPSGREEAKAQEAEDEARNARLQRTFCRECDEVVLDESEARNQLARQWARGAFALAGIEHRDEEGASSGPPTRQTRTRSEHQKPRRARVMVPRQGSEAKQQGSADLELDRFGSLRATEFVRCFLYAVQSMQYAQRKQSATQLCLDFNDILRNRFAVDLLPTAINFLNACGSSTEHAVAMLREASREQVRARKLLDAARAAWTGYQDTDAFRRVMARLAHTLQPSRRALAPQPHVSAPDAHETMSTSHRTTASTAITAATSGRAGAGGGNVTSMYKGVVAQYVVAINYLRQKHSTELLVTALHELGRIHLLHRVRVEAERAWSDVVDACIGRVNVVANWRHVMAAADGDLVPKMGLWRLLATVAALANLAQFSYPEHQKKATDCCMLAAELLWRLQSTSLSCAQREWDQALATVTEMLPGTAPDADCSVLNDLAHGLMYIAEHTLRAGFPLQAIAAASFLEHLAATHIRSVPMTVTARILKAQGAAATGNFNAALSTLHGVLRGRALPEETLGFLGVTFDIIDRPERQGTTSQATRPSKGEKGGAKSGKEDTAAKRGDDASSSGMPEFDNNKPPTDESNARAIEHLAQHFNPQTWALPEAVAAEYGQVVSRRVQLAVAAVLLAVGGADVSLAWISAAEAASAEAMTPSNAAKTGGGGGAKVDKAAAKQPGAIIGDCANASTAALTIAERILNTLYRPRPKTPLDANPAPAGGRGARAQTPNNATNATGVVAGVDGGGAVEKAAEDHFVRQRARLMLGQLWRRRGVVAKAIDVLEDAVHAHNAFERGPQATEGVPSFLYAVDGRQLTHLFIGLAGCYMEQQRWEAAKKAIENGSSLAEQVHDELLQRELHELRVRLLLSTGFVAEAREELRTLATTSQSLDWRGLDGRWANMVVWRQNIEDDCGDLSMASDVATLQRIYDPTHGDAAADLQLALELLQQRAQGFGLNPALTDAWMMTAHRFNPAVRELHVAVNTLAVVALRHGRVGTVTEMLRDILRLSAQGDASRNPHQVSKSQLLLAQCLRVRRGQPDFAVEDAAAVESNVNEALSLLEEVTTASVAAGIHDHELLRQACCEAFLAHLASPDAASHERRIAGYATLYHACTIRALQASVFAGAAVFADAVVPGTDELPRAIVDDLEELARREGHDQAALQRAAGRTASNPPVTTAIIAGYFASLHRRYRTAPVAELALLEAKLSRLRTFIATRLVNVLPVPMLLTAAPAVSMSNSAVPKAQSLYTQCYPASICEAPFEMIEGVEHPTLPHVLLLIAVHPEAVDANAGGATAIATAPSAAEGAAGAGKGVAAATRGAKKDTHQQQQQQQQQQVQQQAAQQRERASGDVGEAAKSGPVSPLCTALRLDQGRLRDIHTKAKRLLALLDAEAEHVTLMEEMAADAAATASAGAKDGAKGKSAKDTAAKSKDGAVSGGSAPGASAGSASPNAAAAASASAAVVDDLKGSVLFGLLELLLTARAGGPVAPKVLEPLYPPFALQAAHIDLIAQMTNSSGGTATADNPEFIAWISRLITAPTS